MKKLRKKLADAEIDIVSFDFNMDEKIKAGMTRIGLISKKTLKWLKSISLNMKYEFYSAFCAIPEKTQSSINHVPSSFKMFSNKLKDI